MLSNEECTSKLANLPGRRIQTNNHSGGGIGLELACIAAENAHKQVNAPPACTESL